MGNALTSASVTTSALANSRDVNFYDSDAALLNSTRTTNMNNSTNINNNNSNSNIYNNSEEYRFVLSKQSVQSSSPLVSIPLQHKQQQQQQHHHYQQQEQNKPNKQLSPSLQQLMTEPSSPSANQRLLRT